MERFPQHNHHQRKRQREREVVREHVRQCNKCVTPEASHCTKSLPHDSLRLTVPHNFHDTCDSNLHTTAQEHRAKQHPPCNKAAPEVANIPTTVVTLTPKGSARWAAQFSSGPTPVYQAWIA